MTSGPDARKLHLPPDKPFTVASALAAGSTARRMRAADLDARVYGVRASRGSADDFSTRCEMFATRLHPDVFFSHSTAARFLGVPLPRHLERLPTLHVSVSEPTRAPHAKGLRGHSRAVFEGDIVESRGVRHSSPTRTFCEMAGAVRLPDLVAIADYLIRRRAPLCSIGDLGARLELGDRITRHHHLRVAIECADERSESRPETHLRLLLIGAGLPSARINHELVDTESGRRMRTDFAYPSIKFAIEYQGDYHRTRTQRRADMTRRSRLEAMGWYVMEVNADDLRDPVELASRIQDVLARR